MAAALNLEEKLLSQLPRPEPIRAPEQQQFTASHPRGIWGTAVGTSSGGQHLKTHPQAHQGGEKRPLPTREDLVRCYHICVATGLYEQADNLLQKGAVTVDERYPFGETPLHHAAYAGNLEAVNWLLARGANVTIRETGQNLEEYLARIWSQYPGGETPMDWLDRAPKENFKLHNKEDVALALYQSAARSGMAANINGRHALQNLPTLPQITAKLIESYRNEE